MKRIISWIAMFSFAALGILAYRIITRSGMLKEIRPHADVACRTVRGVTGAEDVTIDRETMIAYLSADDRRARAKGAGKRGEIYALDVARRDAMPVPLTGGVPADLHPHGISLWRGTDGEKKLFVINHPDSGAQEVLIFEVAPERLTLSDTITYPDLASPNDLIAVGPRQFYASNDRGYREPGLMATLEAYLQLPLSSLSYFDGEKGSLAATSLVFANGVNASAGGERIYVAECLGRAVRVFDRDPASAKLSERDRIPLDSCPDNIEVDENGDLWIGAHPKVFDLLAHMEDAAKLAPTQVLRVDPRSGAVEEVYLDDGTSISAASVAAVGGDRMVIGAIFDDKILVCDRAPKG